MEIIEAVLLSWKKEWKCLAQAKKKIEKERKRKKSVRERETERSSRSKSIEKILLKSLPTTHFTSVELFSVKCEGT